MKDGGEEKRMMMQGSTPTRGKAEFRRRSDPALFLLALRPPLPLLLEWMG